MVLDDPVRLLVDIRPSATSDPSRARRCDRPGSHVNSGRSGSRASDPSDVAIVVEGEGAPRIEGATSERASRIRDASRRRRDRGTRSAPGCRAASRSRAMNSSLWFSRPCPRATVALHGRCSPPRSDRRGRRHRPQPGDHAEQRRVAGVDTQPIGSDRCGNGLVGDHGRWDCRPPTLSCSPQPVRSAGRPRPPVSTVPTRWVSRSTAATGSPDHRRPLGWHLRTGSPPSDRSGVDRRRGRHPRDARPLDDQVTISPLRLRCASSIRAAAGCHRRRGTSRRHATTWRGLPPRCGSISAPTSTGSGAGTAIKDLGWELSYPTFRGPSKRTQKKKAKVRTPSFRTPQPDKRRRFLWRRGRHSSADLEEDLRRFAAALARASYIRRLVPIAKRSMTGETTGNDSSPR